MRALRLLLVMLGAGALVVACNAVLGIDEQGTRATPPDGGADAAPDARAAIERCVQDSDCIVPNACYTAHCDTVVGACTYALCEAKDQTCAAGVCNPKTFACSDPQPYAFFATRYDVPTATSGCGPNPRDCVAAVFPFLFLGTRDAAIALRTDDPMARTASLVRIDGLTAVPQRIIASGRRLWVLGPVQGAAPPYQLAIASLDVPSDPTVAVIHAVTQVVGYPFPTVTAFASPNGGLYVVHPSAALGFPTALLASEPAPGAALMAAPAADAGVATPARGALTMFPAAKVVAGSSAVASSGARLVLYRGGSTFDLVTQPGTAAAATQADLALAPALAPVGPITFAQGPDGTVMAAAPVNADNAPPDCSCTTHARLQWLFPNAIATATDVGQLLDPDAWSNPANAPPPACRVCAGGYFAPPVLATWLDRRSVLTATPASGAAAARAVTDVRYLGRDPADGNPLRRASSLATDHGNFATDRIALTSGAGFGYLVLADGEGNGVSVTMIDARCDAK